MRVKECHLMYNVSPPRFYEPNKFATSTEFYIYPNECLILKLTASDNNTFYCWSEPEQNTVLNKGHLSFLIRNKTSNLIFVRKNSSLSHLLQRSNLTSQEFFTPLSIYNKLLDNPTNSICTDK